jgi:ADP-heptose:LPS heptosyltransferase
MKKKCFININGGIGRVISSTGVIDKFIESNPDYEVNIVSSFPEVFFNNPNINKVYSISHEYLYDDHIKGSKYLEPEPYKIQGYIDCEMHIVNGFSKELLNSDEYISPSIKLTQEELSEAENFIKSQPKPVILFQPFGSMGGMTRDGINVLEDKSYRSLPNDFAKKLYDELSKKYIVVFIHAQNQMPLDKNWVSIPPMPFRKTMALIPFCEKIVCVDSSLQHACAALGKKATVFWGSTNSNQLGYELHENLEGEKNKVQYNPVRMPGNDMDSEKRYSHVWDYLKKINIPKFVRTL